VYFVLAKNKDGSAVIDSHLVSDIIEKKSKTPDTGGGEGTSLLSKKEH